jgi:hypothetical protein
MTRAEHSASAAWPGTRLEYRELVRAIQNYCTCESGGGPALPPVRCPGHTLLTEDQRGLSRLVYARRLRDQLLAEEHA